MMPQINVDELELVSSTEDRILFPYVGELTDELMEQAYIIAMRNSLFSDVSELPQYEQVVKAVQTKFYFGFGKRTCGVVVHLQVEPVCGKAEENKFVIRLSDSVIEQIMERYFCGNTGLSKEYEDLYRTRYLKWRAQIPKT